MSHREQTELEKALAANKDYAFVRGISGSPTEIQSVLDTIAPEICKKVGSGALVEHMRVIYDETADTYLANPEHKNVPDALLGFMDYLPDGANVLDLGCGFGRDAVFMALRNAEKRKQFLGRMKDGKTAFERFEMPTKSFRVLGIDVARRMELVAYRFAQAHGLNTDVNDPPADTVFLGGIEMHNLYDLPLCKLYDGAWSSAALFMHTPQALIRPALLGVAKALEVGGIFGVSYANNSANLPYDNLRYSRTGEIKYFSRPTYAKIASAAESSGFIVREEQFSDLEMDGIVKVVKKNFFITQIFQKR